MRQEGQGSTLSDTRTPAARNQRPPTIYSLSIIMKKTIFFSVALSALLISCKSPMIYITRTAETTKMPIETWAQWTTSDLEVSPTKARVTVDAPRDKKMTVSESALKENAIGELLEKNNADILVNPLFTCEYIDGKLARVTVSGYPARHTNFRSITFEEQTNYLIEKEKAKNSPQIVINGGEIKNEVVAPAPAPAAAPAVAAPSAAAPSQSEASKTSSSTKTVKLKSKSKK